MGGSGGGCMILSNSRVRRSAAAPLVTLGCGHPGSVRSLGAVLGYVLVVDPAVGPFHAVAQPDGRLPAKVLLDEGVIGVTAVDPLWGGKVVAALELEASDVFDDVHKLVDCDEFA